MLYDAWGGQSCDLIPIDFDEAVMSFLGAIPLVGLSAQGMAEIRLIRNNGRGYRPTGLELWWLLASTILLSSISMHYYIVDTFIWRRTVGA